MVCEASCKRWKNISDKKRMSLISKRLFTKTVKMSTIQVNIALFHLHILKVKIIVQVSQVQTQLKSGFASKVSAYSKNFLMAALVKKSKVHFDIFRYPLPASSLLPSGEIQSSLRTFIMSISCTVSSSVTFSAQFPTAFYRGQQLGPHLSMHFAVQSKEILLSVHQAFCPLNIHLTQSTLDLWSWTLPSG